MLQYLEADELSVAPETARYYDPNRAYRLLWANMLKNVWCDLTDQYRYKAAMRYVIRPERKNGGLSFRDLCDGLDIDHEPTVRLFMSRALMFNKKLANKLSKLGKLN